MFWLVYNPKTKLYLRLGGNKAYPLPAWDPPEGAPTEFTTEADAQAWVDTLAGGLKVKKCCWVLGNLP